jgi:hypothetical protein
MGFDRHGEFGQVAPLAMDQVEHAFLAAHLILAVGMIGEAR